MFWTTYFLLNLIHMRISHIVFYPCFKLLVIFDPHKPPWCCVTDKLQKLLLPIILKLQIATSDKHPFWRQLVY